MSDREKKRDPEKTGDRAEDAELVEDLDVQPDEESEDVKGGLSGRVLSGAPVPGPGSSGQSF